MVVFLQPLALLILLVLPPLWFLACASWRATTERRGVYAPQHAGRVARWRALLARAPWRFWTGILLPTLAITALTLALAGMHVVLPVATQSVVFLLDHSDSVAVDERARTEAYVRRALAALPSGDQAGVVVFGQSALVARPLAADRTLGPIAAQPDGRRTNIGAAVQLALAMLPPTGQRRLVLLSDGVENAGDARGAAQLAAARGIPLEVVPLRAPPDGLDVQVSAAGLPHNARAGQRVQLRIATTSPITTTAQLRVLNNGASIIDQPATLPAGSGSIAVELPPPSAGFNRYQVHVDIAGDVRPQNNVVETYTVVGGPPRVLLVARVSQDARNLGDALAAGGVAVETAAPADLPTTLGGLNRFDAVVLVDMPRADLPPATEALLPAYVRDAGHGLLVVGGPQSFGLGGYSGSPLETVLPVTMVPPPKEPVPPVSVVVVIDISGSMGEFVADTTKQQLAAAGVARIAAQLRDDDEITVIPFDRAAKNTIGPLAGRQRGALADLLGRIGPGAGGIDYFNSVQEAARYLRASNKPVRHLITITDGDDTVQQEGAQQLVRQLYAEHVTTTALAVGDGSDVAFLQGVARNGGGRFFLANTATSIPDFMSEEASLLLRSYLVERPFTPAFTPEVQSSPVLSGISALPQLGGYIATAPKERSQVLLRAANDDPLLATWRYGLGHSAVWTSDLTGRWGRDLVQSPSFPKLAAQLIAWLLPPPSSEQLTLAATSSGDQLQIVAAAHDAAGHLATSLHITGQLLASDGSARSLALREVVPGNYRISVPDLPPDTYEIRLLAADANGDTLATAAGGAVLANFSEYRGAATNEMLLGTLAQSTGGRVDPPSSAVFDPTPIAPGGARDLTRPLVWLALALLPIDLALRRLHFGGRWAQETAPLRERSALALIDQLWRTVFGHEPFYALRRRRVEKLHERERWVAWLREQADRRAKGEE